MKTKKYYSPKEYLDAAKSDAAPVEELKVLAFSEYDFVRLAVAGNVNVTTDILTSLLPEKLNTPNTQAIASEIAQNSKTSPETLERMAEKLILFLNKDRGNGLTLKTAIHLFRNINTPIDALKLILNSDAATTHTRRRLARETNRKDVLEMLVGDKSEAVRKRAFTKLETLK